MCRRYQSENIGSAVSELPVEEALKLLVTDRKSDTLRWWVVTRFVVVWTGYRPLSSSVSFAFGLGFGAFGRA